MPFRKILVFSFFFILLFSVDLLAQETKKEDQTTTKKEFTLDITNETFTEENYRANVRVAAETPTKPAVSIDVGVGIEAKNITVTLINVKGDVLFEGSLEELLKKLKLNKKETNKQDETKQNEVPENDN